MVINGKEQLVWKCLPFEIAPAEDYPDGSVTSWQHKVFSKAEKDEESAVSNGPRGDEGKPVEGNKLHLTGQTISDDVVKQIRESKCVKVEC